ncbi:hypothetical protein [Bradyrhizobium sp. 930_D9_N1_4]|uniref:hypothetical protein n=1 Tax=Bradyrhizobium sp. 930_D9_N1_4 TaxID=3240374 RepID=UPI003F8C9EE2
MAEIIGEMLFAIVRGFISQALFSLFVKAGTWLDGKISRRSAKVAIGMVCGLGLYFLIPVVLGLRGL